MLKIKYYVFKYHVVTAIQNIDLALDKYSARRIRQ